MSGAAVKRVLSDDDDEVTFAKKPKVAAEAEETKSKSSESEEMPAPRRRLRKLGMAKAEKRFGILEDSSSDSGGEQSEDDEEDESDDYMSDDDSLGAKSDRDYLKENVKETKEVNSRSNAVAKREVSALTAEVSALTQENLAAHRKREKDKETSKFSKENVVEEPVSKRGQLNEVQRSAVLESCKARGICPERLEVAGKGDAAKVYFAKYFCEKTKTKVDRVLRRVVLPTKEDVAAFWKEVSKQRYLAAFGLAPRVTMCWICDFRHHKPKEQTVGLLLMEKLEYIHDVEWSMEGHDKPVISCLDSEVEDFVDSTRAYRNPAREDMCDDEDLEGPFQPPHEYEF